MPLHTYITLLRSVNVSGHHLIKMADLKALYESLGCSGVRTFIQSGNVVFHSGMKNTELVEERLEQAIESTFGFHATVVARTPAQLSRIIDDNPFVDRKGTDSKRLLVAFLKSRSARERVQAFTAAAAKSDDECVPAPAAVYLHCPNGYGRSMLTSTFIEKHLGVEVTVRNWNTTTTLLELSRTVGA
jgi:uncharacterized protein (DUF1697 family)